MIPFERSLPMMLYRAIDAVLPAFRAIFAEAGLTEPQWRVLRMLWEHDDTTVAELASATLISAPSLVGVIDRLESADLVKRQPSQRDRRQVHVRLTAAGRALEKRVRPQVTRAYTRLEAMMTASQWRALYASLDRLNDAFTLADAAATRPRLRKRRRAAPTVRDATTRRRTAS